MAKKDVYESVKILAVTIAPETRVVVRDSQGRPVPGENIGTTISVRYVFLNKEGKRVSIEGKGDIRLLENIPKGADVAGAINLSSKAKKALNEFISAIRADIEKHENI